MIDAYLSVLRAQWFFLTHYGWVLLLLAVIFLAFDIYLSRHDSL